MLQSCQTVKKKHMPKTTHQQPTANSPLKDLLLLFSIPVAIIIIAAGLIYIPRLLANPKYDFVYSVCDDYRCKNDYSLDSSGRVVENTDADSPKSSYYDQLAQLRYYDASTNATRSITLDEAQRYRLDSSSQSPDGYTLTREGSSSGFLFWSDRDDGWYLKDGAKKKEVELTMSKSYYSQGIKFLGWVGYEQ